MRTRYMPSTLDMFRQMAAPSDMVRSKTNAVKMAARNKQLDIMPYAPTAAEKQNFFLRNQGATEVDWENFAINQQALRTNFEADKINSMEVAKDSVLGFFGTGGSEIALGVPAGLADKAAGDVDTNLLSGAAQTLDDIGQSGANLAGYGNEYREWSADEAVPTGSDLSVGEQTVQEIMGGGVLTDIGEALSPVLHGWKNSLDELIKSGKSGDIKKYQADKAEAMAAATKLIDGRKSANPTSEEIATAERAKAELTYQFAKSESVVPEIASSLAYGVAASRARILGIKGGQKLAKKKAKPEKDTSQMDEKELVAHGVESLKASVKSAKSVKNAGKWGGRGATGVAIGLLEGTGNANQAYDEVIKAKHDDLYKTNKEYKKLIDSGISKAKAKEQIAQNASSIAFDRTAGVAAGTGAILSTLEKVLPTAKTSTTKVASKAIDLKAGAVGLAAVKGAGNVTSETVEELTQSAAGAVIANRAKQENINADQDLQEGVTQASVEGGLIGGLSVASSPVTGAALALGKGVSKAVLKKAGIIGSKPKATPSTPTSETPPESTPEAPSVVSEQVSQVAAGEVEISSQDVTELKSGTLETLQKEIVAQQVNSTLSEPEEAKLKTVALKIDKEIARREELSTKAAEEGEEQPVFGIADGKLENLLNQKEDADTAEGMTADVKALASNPERFVAEVANMDESVLHNVRLQAGLDATNESLSKEVRATALEVQVLADRAQNLNKEKSDKAAKNQDQIQQQEAVQVKNTVGNLAEASQADVVAATGSILSGNTEATEQENTSVINKYIDGAKIDSEHGSVTMNGLRAAGQALVKATGAVKAIMGSEYNAEGRANLEAINVEDNTRLGNAKKNLLKAIAQGDANAVETEIKNINDGLNNKRKNLKGKYRGKAHTDLYKSYVSAEIAQGVAVAEFAKKLMDASSTDFSGVNLKAVSKAPTISLGNEGVSAKQTKALNAETSADVSLTGNGASWVMRHLLSTADLDSPNTQNELAKAIGEAALTDAERKWLADTLQNKGKKFAKDGAGKTPEGMVQGILSKLDATIRDGKFQYGSLAQMLQTTEPEAFTRLYEESRLVDITEQKIPTQAELDKGMGKAHTKYSARQKLDMISDKGRVQLEEELATLEGHIEAAGDTKYTPAAVSAVTATTALKEAINNAAEYIDTNAIPNKYTRTKANPFNTTPDYNLSDTIASSLVGRVKEIIKVGTGKLANQVHDVLNVLKGNTLGSNALMNGLNAVQKSVVGKFAEQVSAISTAAQAHYASAIASQGKAKSANDYQNSLQNILDTVGELDAKGDPKSMLYDMFYTKDANGKVVLNEANLAKLMDTSVLTAMTFALTEGAGDHSEALRETLGNQQKIPKGQIATTSMSQDLRNAGQTRAYFEKIIGRHVAESLGLSVTDESSVFSQAMLETNLGLFAITALEDAGFAKASQYSVSYNKDNGTIESKKPVGKDKGISFITFNTKNVAGFKKANPALNTITDFLSRLVKSNSDTTGILTEAVKTRNKMNSEPVPKHAEALDRAAALGATPDFKLIGAYLDLTEPEQLALMGEEDPHAEGSAVLPIQVESAEANVTELRRVIELLRHIHSNQEDHKSIHQLNILSRNLRLTQHSGTTWQGNKLMRAMLSTQETEFKLGKEHTLSAADGFPEGVTQLDAFKVAVARMFNVDKLHFVDTLDWFSNMFEQPNSKARYAAMTARKIAYEGKDGVTKEELEDMYEVVHSGSMHMETMAGLVAAGEFIEATANPEVTSFTSRVFREDDGIANGIAINMALFGIKTESVTELANLYSRVGVSFQGTADIFALRGNATESKPMQDMYEYFSTPTTQKVDATGLAGNVSDGSDGTVQLKLDGLSAKDAATHAGFVKQIKDVLLTNDPKALTKLMRNLIKEPLMRYVYGAGNAAILENVRQQITDSIISEVQEKYQAALKNDLTNKAVRDEFDANVSGLNKSLKNLSLMKKSKAFLSFIPFVESKKPYVQVRLIKGKAEFVQITPAHKKFKKKTKTNKASSTHVPEKILNITSKAHLSKLLTTAVDTFVGNPIVAVIAEEFGDTRQVAQVFQRGVTMQIGLYVATYNELVKAATIGGKRLTVGQLKEIKKQLKEAFKGIPSALTNQVNKSIDELETSGSMIKVHKDNLSKDSGDEYVNQAVNGKKDSTTVSRSAPETVLSAAHTEATPILVHSVDASIIIEALLADGSIHQVYDGLIQAANKNNATVASNKAFREFTFSGEYNVLAALNLSIQDSFNNVAVLMNPTIKDKKKLKKEAMKLFTEELTTESATYVNAEGDVVKRVISPQLYMKQLVLVSDALAAQKEALNSIPDTTVNQYGDIYQSLKKGEHVAGMTLDTIFALENARNAFKDAVAASDTTSWDGVMEDVETGEQVSNEKRSYTDAITPAGTKLGVKARQKELAAREKREGKSGVGTVEFNRFIESVNNHLAKLAADAGNEDRAGYLAAVNDYYQDVFMSFEVHSLTDAEGLHMIAKFEDYLGDKGELIASVTSRAKIEEQLSSENTPTGEVQMLDFHDEGMVDSDPTIDGNSDTTTSHGSSSDADLLINLGEFDQDLQQSVVSARAQEAVEVFDNMPTSNKAETPQDPLFTAELRKLVGELGKLYNTLGHAFNVKVYQQRGGDNTFGRVQGSSANDMGAAQSDIQIFLRKDTPTGSVSQSGQEVLAHEMIHPFWDMVMNKDLALKNEAIKLFEFVQSIPNLNHSIFLPKGVTPTANDIKVAKEMFKHVFDNGTEGLVEFLTMGKTNLQFRNNLAAEIVSYKDANAARGFMAKLGRLFNKVLSLIAGRAHTYDTQSLSVQAALDNLYLQGQSQFNSARDLSIHAKAAGVVGNAVDKFDSTLNKGLSKAFQTVTPLAFKLHKNITGEELTASEALKMTAEATRKLARGTTKNLNHQVREMLSPMAGDPISHSEKDRLIAKGSSTVDAYSAREKAGVLSALKEAFEREITPDEHRSITDVIGRSDLSALFEYGSMELDDIADILEDPTKLEAEITKLKTDMLNGSTTSNSINSVGLITPIVNALDRRANATANFLVNENQNEGVYLQNAHFILNNVEQYIGSVPATQKAETLAQVDRLITLYAVQKTAQVEKQRIADMIKDPATRYGIQMTLAMQQSIKATAMETQFKDTPHYYKKGHYTQITDQNKDVVFAPLSEAALLRKGNYSLKEEITVPAGALSTTPLRMGVFVRNFGGNRKRSNSALIATQNSKYGEALGSVIETVNGGLPAASAIMNNKVHVIGLETTIAQETIAFSKGIRPVRKTGISNMVPVPTVDGRIREFRLHAVDSAFKKKHLNLDENFMDSLATSASRLAYKEAAPIHNAEVIDYLRDVYEKDFALEPDAFYEMKTDDPLIIDQYQTLNDDAKARLASTFGKGRLVIKRSQVNGIFGYKHWSVTDLQRKELPQAKALDEIMRVMHNGILVPMLNNKLVIWLEYAQQEYVAELAKTIVVKTADVLEANTISNYGLTMLMGMNPITTARDAAQGLRIGIDFLNLLDEQGKAKVNLDIAIADKTASPTKLRNLRNKLGTVTGVINNHAGKEYFDNGLLSTVVLDHANDISGGQTGRGKLRAIGDRTVLKGVVGEAIKESYAMEDSNTYNVLQMGTIMSDFAFKVAVHEHHKREGKLSKKESFDRINYIFLAYESPSSKPVAYLESIGLLMFTKYALRIQRVIITSFADNPSRVIRTAMMQDWLAPTMPNMLDSSWLGDSSPFSMVQNPWSKVNTILTPQPLNFLFKSAI